MLHLTWSDGDVDVDVLLFGSGTIGSEISGYLHRAGASVLKRVPIPWDTTTEAVRTLSDHVEGTQRRATQVAVVWAAGSTGFGATASDIEAEFQAFDAILTLFEGMTSRQSGVDFSFHLLSSAGGLFEGCHTSDVTAVPRPLRPYGQLKLQQEVRARALRGFTSIQLYRPSSVYTVPSGRRRPGLVGTLIANGMDRRPSSIVGALDTLRDYVSARDVGRFIGRRVLQPLDRHVPISTSMLVSGEPAPISLVIHNVERALRRRLLLEVRDSWNAANITFASSVRAPEFRPMSLLEGTFATYMAMASRRWIWSGV